MPLHPKVSKALTASQAFGKRLLVKAGKLGQRGLFATGRGIKTFGRAGLRELRRETINVQALGKEVQTGAQKVNAARNVRLENMDNTATQMGRLKGYPVGYVQGSKIVSEVHHEMVPTFARQAVADPSFEAQLRKYNYIFIGKGGRRVKFTNTDFGPLGRKRIATKDILQVMESIKAGPLKGFIPKKTTP